MLINFEQQQERKMPGMNDGTGEMSAKMFMDNHGKIIPSRIHKGGSIGMHRKIYLLQEIVTSVKKVPVIVLSIWGMKI